MSAATDLYSSFRDYLEITTRATPKAQDDFINVDERFILRVTVTNKAPDDGPFRNPIIHYQKLRVTIQATEYAAPLDGEGRPVDSVTMDMGEADLEPGDRHRWNFQMKALKNMGGLGDFFGQEKIARVKVRGAIDQDAYFRVRKSLNAQSEIEPT